MERYVVTGDVEQDAEAIAEAAACLRDGGLVAFPTETVYGLGAVAYSHEAVTRIFAAKGRPADDPVIVHVLRDWPLTEVFQQPTDLLLELVDRFWPGPLTIVSEKSTKVPGIVTAGLDTVAVRSPSHPIASRLLDALGLPIAAPSANRFSYVSATTADHVVSDLGDKVDLILDNGPSDAGIESTVVRVGDGGLEVLRHGAVAVETLVEVGLQIRDLDGVPDDRDRSSSPGRQVRHYSPRTPTLACAFGTVPTSLDAHRICLLTYADVARVVPTEWTIRHLGRIADLRGVARSLYGCLRSLDSEQFDLIVVELTGRGGLGRAVDDRIRRAASGRVV